MPETFDSSDLRAVAAAMRAFGQQCDEILALLGEKRHLSIQERMEVEGLYRTLKADLKEAAKCGTLSGRRHPLTRAEACFYDPAVRRAAIDLRPATNSDPISSRWFSAVYEARSEFAYWLHNLSQLPSAPH